MSVLIIKYKYIQMARFCLFTVNVLIPVPDYQLNIHFAETSLEHTTSGPTKTFTIYRCTFNAIMMSVVWGKLTVLDHEL